MIPGAEGQIEPGARRLNWVWYWNVPEPALEEVMTGADGTVRGVSVPPGQVRPELLERQNAIAEARQRRAHHLGGYGGHPYGGGLSRYARKLDEMPELIDCYRVGAKQAMDAGFDGVEIHGANGSFATRGS